MTNLNGQTSEVKVTHTRPADEPRGTYVVRYRVGGTERFEWKSTVGMSHDDAFRTMHEVRIQGYAAVVALSTWKVPTTYLYTGMFITRSMVNGGQDDMPNDNAVRS